MKAVGAPDRDLYEKEDALFSPAERFFLAVCLNNP